MARNRRRQSDLPVTPTRRAASSVIAAVIAAVGVDDLGVAEARHPPGTGFQRPHQGRDEPWVPVVVEDQDLQSAVALPAGAQHGLAEQGGPVERRDEDRN